MTPTAASAPLASEAVENCWIDSLSLVADLRKRAFARLTTQLEGLSAKVQQGACSDLWMRKALSAFANTDPTLTEDFDHWVETEPRSGWARAARGEHRHARALNNRGGRYASETPAEQLAAMDREFEGASQDLRNAIGLDKNLTPAYATLISIASAGSGPLQERPIAARGFEIAPHSFAIRFAILQRLQPKWGGSLAAIDRMLADTRKYEGRDPQLRSLRGYRLMTEADMLPSEQAAEALAGYDAALALGDLPWAHIRRSYALWSLDRLDEVEAELRDLLARHEYPAMALAMLGRLAQERGHNAEAIDFFDRALAYDGGDAGVLRRRAWLAWRLGQKQDALANLATAVQVAPSRADVHGLFAELLYRAKRRDEALVISERAVTLDPGSAYHWRYRGLSLLSVKRHNDALNAFDRAIALSPKNAQLRFERAFAYEQGLGDLVHALIDYREAARLAPQAAGYQYALASAAFHAHDCDVVTASRAYRTLCEAGRCGSRSARQLKWAQRQSTDPVYASRCPAEYAHGVSPP